MFRDLRPFAQFYAYSYRICIDREICFLVTGTIGFIILAIIIANLIRSPNQRIDYRHSYRPYYCRRCRNHTRLIDKIRSQNLTNLVRAGHYDVYSETYARVDILNARDKLYLIYLLKYQPSYYINTTARNGRLIVVLCNFSDKSIVSPSAQLISDLQNVGGNF